ncbi:MAG: hypothetical protein QOE23_716 [Pseudonocardiales bacterium]|nr:hypothetical protein [Pseudonocardiales bacterium]
MSIPSNHDDTNASHNVETNTAASDAELCGMTHLPNGRVCLLPKGHPGGCDFRPESDIEAAIKLR